MYSILPALVSLLFLACGIYALSSGGPSRTVLACFLLCATTFCWQFTWAILFQLKEPSGALVAAKFGYLLILFVPTTLYHFVVEIGGAEAERYRVACSYGLAALLAVALLSGDALVAGLHHYFFGFYPKAGPLHPLHLLQTALVVTRALYLLYRRQRHAVPGERARLRYRLISLLIYFFAAIDYLCNYGVAFYPPGVLFIALSLALCARAAAQHDFLAHPIQAAATVAHELRTPLLSIRAQARALNSSLPDLIAGYRHALAHGYAGTLERDRLQFLLELGPHIEGEVRRANFVVDSVLASAGSQALAPHTFAAHSVQRCVDEALARYPFEPAARARVRVCRQQDFTFYGSDTLFVHVLHNLLKNALHATEARACGEVLIAFYRCRDSNALLISDTGHGIPAHVLPHVFDPFYTTRAGGNGLGLAFCRRVLGAFGASIGCESHEGREGRRTTFRLEFPKTPPG